METAKLEAAELETAKLEAAKLEPILHFTDAPGSESGLRNSYGNYSFRKVVYDDFIKRRDKIKNAFNLGDVKFSMVGSIKNESKKSQYILDTTIGFDKEVSSNLLTIVNFLNNMAEAPEKILDNKIQQDNFKQAVFSLKKDKIKVDKVFALREEFQKNYGFDEYLFYGPEVNCLNYFLWENKKISDYECGTLCKHEISLASLSPALLELNKLGLIAFDYKKILELKAQHREKFFKHSSSKKDIAYYKRIVEEEQKIEHPLFSITKEADFNKIIDTLEENELLCYFPFSSRFDVEFLSDVLRNGVGRGG